MSQVFNYDPNIKWGVHKVKITLAQWDYRAERVVEIAGNCYGFSVLESAMDALYELIREENSIPNDYEDQEISEEGLDFSLLLHRDSDDADLLCEPDRDDFIEWLKDMVLSMEIIDNINTKHEAVA